MNTFAGIKSEDAGLDNSQILLQPIPYDGTSTWGKGADKGFDAFMQASEHMEIYDIETDSTVCEKGIHTLEPIKDFSSPEKMVLATYKQTKKLLETGKFLTFFGGEHSVSIGVIRAFIEKYPDISVLQLDAHTDLRPTYMGSPYNHACALHEASHRTNLVQVGIRSMDTVELEYFDPSKCFFARDIHDSSSWMDDAIQLLSDKVYITLDLDVFDPAVMPATGTPEPGGMDWYTVTKFLRSVFSGREVLGFDIVELAPISGNISPEFMAAKLYYKMLSYKFKYDEE
jgi:agmatinase